MKKLYEIIVINIGGRSGEVYLLDNVFYFDIFVLIEFGGDGGGGINLE